MEKYVNKKYLLYLKYWGKNKKLNAVVFNNLAANHFSGEESINYTAKTYVLVRQSRVQAVKASILLRGC